jgi:hypothetical protein
MGGIQMITIHIDEYVNGFTLRGFDNKDGYFLNEIHEERIEALKALYNWVGRELKKELDKRQRGSMEVI